MVWMLVLLLGQQPSARDHRDPPAELAPSAWRRRCVDLRCSATSPSPPMVWVEVLLLGRQPSARDHRDPLVVLAVQLASLTPRRVELSGWAASRQVNGNDAGTRTRVDISRERETQQSQ
ncbi:hypothetical protein NQZ68_008373 [Dissostichus eleginoides]|nr:hypothetical protein NQZ68_008373 [Dissostichus eleginoides]